MNKISIQEAKLQGSGQVSVAGWVRNRREHKGVIFVDLHDISGSIQVVFASDMPCFAVAQQLTLESVIHLSGSLKPKPAPKNNPDAAPDFELLAEKAEIISLADENLPIPVLTKSDNEASLDLSFDWRWLDLRQPEKQRIFKVWTALEAGFRDYFLQNNFIQVYTPCFMSTASETGSEVFEVKYFDRKAYLAQSPQFYKQMAIASGFERVFAFGTVFRAEPSFTTRHVTEFTGWDFEMAYIESHEDIMLAEEGMLVAGFAKLKELGIDLEVPKTPFPRISLADAKQKLQAASITSEKDHDFSPEEERELSSIIKQEQNHDFVFVTDYPIEARPFYHMRHADNPKLTKSFDLLYRGVEITTGAQREHRIDILEAQAKEKAMDLEELKDYLNFFRYGCPDHGGAGIGPARLIMRILNLSSVKEACFLPRDVKRLNP